MSEYQRFTLGGFAWRLLAALLLVFITYNPSELSYFHWLKGDASNLLAAKIFVGVVLLIGWVIFVRATSNSLGGVGFLLAAAFFGTLIWVLIDFGILPTESTKAVTYLVEFALAAVLGIE